MFAGVPFTWWGGFQFSLGAGSTSVSYVGYSPVATGSGVAYKTISAPPTGTAAGDLIIAVVTHDTNDLHGLVSAEGWNRLDFDYEVGDLWRWLDDPERAPSKHLYAGSNGLEILWRIATASEPTYRFVLANTATIGISLITLRGADQTAPFGNIAKQHWQATGAGSKLAPAVVVNNTGSATFRLWASVKDASAYTLPSSAQTQQAVYENPAGVRYAWQVELDDGEDAGSPTTRTFEVLSQTAVAYEDYLGVSLEIVPAGGKRTNTQDLVFGRQRSVATSKMDKLFLDDYGGIIDYENMTDCGCINASLDGYFRSRAQLNSGKWYVEIELVGIAIFGGAGQCWAGIGMAGDGIIALDVTTGHWVINLRTGEVYSASSLLDTFSTFSAGDKLCLAVDLDNDKLYMGQNGTWFGTHDPSAGTGGYDISGRAGAVNLVAEFDGLAAELGFNMGKRAAEYSIPTGFTQRWPTSDELRFDTALFDPTLWAMSNNNLTITKNASGVDAESAFCHGSIFEGHKVYAEFTVTNKASGTMTAGVRLGSTSGTSISYGRATPLSTSGTGYRSGGKVFVGGSTVASGLPTFTTSDVIGVAVDYDAGKVYFRRNGLWVGGGDPVAGTGGYSLGTKNGLPAKFGVSTSNVNTNAWTANFGASAFAHTIPAGYTALVPFRDWTSLPAPLGESGAWDGLAVTLDPNPLLESAANGAHTTATVSSTVTSSHPFNKGNYTYSWVETTYVSGAAITIDTPTAANTTFSSNDTDDIASARFTLTVTDTDTGETATAQVLVAITFGNAA